jgi:hypothetical protein
MRISLRGVLIALVGLVAIGGLISTGALSTASKSPVTAPAKSSGFCSSEGVSLVIDYGSKSNKKPAISCGFSFAGSGWELFSATEQLVEGTTEYPVGFVCRINLFPSAADQPCTSTPTGAQGSWAYYYASSELGDHWLFSAAGAGMRKPKCGDVDGWVFLNPGEKTHQPSVEPMTHTCLQ